MAHMGFGRWLGDPEPFPDYKYTAKLDQIDWMMWHMDNDVDILNTMPDYVYTVPEPPYPYYLDTTPSAMNVTNSMGVFFIHVSSNYNWSVSCSETWLTAEPTSGTGDGVIIMRHSANVGALRTATASITCDLITDVITVTQDTTATNADSAEATRHILVIYAQHETSLEDPLAPGEYNDTATAQYLSQYKHLGYDIDEWIADGFSLAPRPEYNRPGRKHLPLPVLANLKHGNYHPMDCIHVGLSEGAITPYIVPRVGSTDPALVGRAQRKNGYYVSQTPQDYPAGGTNTEGWAAWHSGSDCGYNRASALIQEIMQSDYLATHLSPALKYDKNVPGKIDMIILALPQLYKYGYYLDNDHGYATMTTLIAPKTIHGTTYNKIFWQPYSRNSARVLHHEYMHMAYQGNEEHSNEVFADKAWVGDEPILTLTGFVHDVYCNQFPLPSSPWGGNPCYDCTMEAPAIGWVGIPHPLISASMNMTTLNRWATDSGNYAIGNCQDTMDFLCMQSPYDQEQFMILSAYYPQTLGGTIDYPFSGEKHPAYGTEMKTNGVYATIYKYRNNETSPHTYSNFYNPITNYMIDTMTEQYGYGNIGTQDTRTVTATGQVVENAKCVLIDHDNPTTNPSGLTNANAKFGVLVEWIGWSVVDGIKTANVTITFDTP